MLNIHKSLAQVMPIVVVALYVLGLAVVLMPFVQSSFVIEDDLFYLPRAILNDPFIPDVHQANFQALAWLGQFGSFQVYKAVLVAIFTLNAALLASFLARVWGYPLLASLLALVVIGLPVSVDQYVFFTGAHPSFAMTFILLALHVFHSAYKAQERATFAIGMVVVSALLWFVTQVSPTTTLALFFLPLWLLVASVTEPQKPNKALLWGSIVGVTCLAVGATAMAITGLQYNDLGWVNISTSQILKNLSTALNKLFFAFGNRQSPLFTLFWAGLGMVAVLCLWQSARTRRHRPMLSVVGYSLVVSALTFGPSSVLAGTFSDRYVFLPSVFGALVLVALGMSLAPDWEKRPRALLISALILLLGVNLAGVHRNINAKYAHVKNAHTLILSLSQQESVHWQNNAQVVVFLDSLPNFTDGFNHWSTWYLRGITGKDGLIGLVSEAYRIERQPFVTAYADHDPSYWEEVKDGLGKYRLTMVGLEKDRPTFAYMLFADGSYHEVSLLFPQDTPENFTIVTSGQSYNSAGNVLADSVCADVTSGRAVLWIDTRQQQDYVKTRCRSTPSS
jgi:hypothetical protein